VKLRGQRIELGEVEAVLASVPGVVHAAVTVASSPDGGEHLVGYVSPEAVDVDAVRAAAAGELPGYMVPSVWMIVDQIALNTAGKIDRRALPAPEFGGLEAEYVAPEGDAELAVAEVFAEVLGVDRVSAEASFFDLGGNSLSAMRVIARAGTALDADLGVHDLFEAPSVRELADLASRRGAALPPVTAVVPRPERIPLSFAQQRMWLINRLDTAADSYNIPTALRLPDGVNLAALTGAIRAVVTRHEVLRTVYPAAGEAAVQQILTAADALERLDWAEATGPDELLRSAGLGFDLTTELPIRGRFHRNHDGTTDLLIVVHHIAFDGESSPILLRDVLAAYAHGLDAAVPPQPPLSVQYADYALWERAVLGDPRSPDSRISRERTYWREHLHALPVVTDLPMDRPRPGTFDPRGALHTLTLEPELTGAIDALARDLRLTPFMLTQAALAVTVARLAATRDVVIASPIAGRTAAGIDELVGMFVNTLVLRSDVAPDAAVGDFLAQTRRTVLDAFENPHVPFDDLVEILAPPHTTAHSPLTQIAFTYTEASGDDPAADDQRDSAAGVIAEPLSAGEVSAKFDLTVAVTGHSGPDRPTTVEFIYPTAIFDESTIAGFADVYRRILSGIVADQHIAVGDITVTGSADIARPPSPATASPATASPATAAPTGHTRSGVAGGGTVESGTLIDLLNRRELDPHHPALICDGDELDYAGFEARTNRVARALLARGVRPDDVVAVGLERSIASVVAIWGVIKSGAAYLAVDPAYPRERIEYMLADSAVEFGISDPATGGQFGGGRVDWADLAALEAQAPSDGPILDAERTGTVRLTGLAYLIYTSGSTGRPKGVAVSNTGLADLTAAYTKVTGSLEDDPDTRILHVASLSFDASFFEMAWAVTAGHTLVIAPQAEYAGPALDTVLARDAVTDMVITPSVLATLDPDGADEVRNLATAGEACTPELVQRWTARGRRLWNFYGPSETTVWATRGRMMAGKPVTIGRALRGFTARVLDNRLHEVPAGVVGELYLAADGLARGYLRRPDLTATSFIADPAGTGARLYRTGDLVRQNGNGDLDYAGRADLQVKLRGQRVELGEIEAAVVEVPGVRHAAAAVTASPDGIDHLVGFVSPSTVDLDMIKADLAERMPAHMRPSLWVVLDELPLNPAGKLDRNALPEPDWDRLVDEYVAPETDDERAVAAVFSEVLGSRRVGVTESFFDAGGNSLSAMRVVGRVGEALGVELGVQDLFKAPTVRRLIVAAASAERARAPITAVDPRPVHIPLSFAQQRMWFLNRFDPESSAYNVPLVMTVTGDLDVAALHRAVTDVVTRHEILRTSYPEVAGVPHQQVWSVPSIGDHLDWRVVDSRADFEAGVAAGFDVTAQWPLRVRLVQTGPGEYLLAVVLHHIAADGESLRPLVTDLVTAYSARAHGRDPELPPLPVQFADVALWQHRTLGSPKDPDTIIGRQLGYWRDQLADLPDVLELPADRPRPHRASQRGDTVPMTVPAEVVARLAEVAGSTGATRFMVVHAALAVLLSRLSGTSDIAVGTPTAGRGRQVLDDLIGMFVGTLVLRTEIDPAQSFVDLLDRVQRTDLEAFAHADAPFEAVVDAVDPVRSEAFAPLTQVWLNVHQSAGADGEVPAYHDDQVRLAPVDVARPRANVDLLLTVDAGDEDEPWTGSLTFATDLFEPETAQAIGERFVRLLGALCAEPERPVGEAAILTDEERRRLLGWGDPGRNGPAHASPAPLAESTLADLVARAGERFGDQTAVTHGELTLSHRGLSARVNTLARELIAAGVGPQRSVAVYIPQSIEQILAVHAVVAAGGAYTPIAIDTPADRVEYMVSLSGAGHLLTTTDLLDAPAVAAAAGLGVQVLTVDAAHEPATEVAPVTDAERRGPVRPENTAYTLFTSGSTGRPKGVSVAHRAVIELLAYDREYYGFGPSEVHLQVLSYTFDPSILEIFRWITGGGSLVIPGEAGRTDPVLLGALIEREQVTCMVMVPSMLSVMLDAHGDRDPAWISSVRAITTGGEAVPQPIADRVTSRWPQLMLSNHYGPTEVTIYSICGPLHAGVPVAIGTPLHCSTGYVLDARLQLVPTGVAGELYLGGDLVATGYCGRSDLTADRFVADPFGPPGARLYRTGDVVHWTSDGRLEYLGRTDFQVKLRGQRIELGEVETVLDGAPGVALAAAAVAQAPGGAAHLAAYLTPADVDVEAVRAHAEAELPGYMVPTVWTVLDRLALNTAGKIDRRALPEPEFLSVDSSYVAPETAAEEHLAAIVAGLLGLERVSVTESFFALGGDSIMSIQLASGARAAGLELSPRQIFEHPTIRGMAALTAVPAGADLLDEPADGRIPLSPLMAWMVGAADDPADYADFNQATVLQVPAEITAQQVSEVLATVAAAHPMLSVRLTGAGEQARLTVGEPFDAAYAVTETDAATVGSAAFDDALLAAFEVAAGRLDPARGRQVQARLVRGADGARLVLVIHHLAVDAVSWPILIEDLVTVWGQRAAGHPVSVRPEITSAGAWHAALADRAVDHTDELHYWLARSAAEPTDLGAPLDPARDRFGTLASVLHTVGTAVTRPVLTRIPDAFGGSVNDVLLGTLARAVRSWQRDRGIPDETPVTVLAEGHGRYEELIEAEPHPRRADLSRTVGWFTTIAPLQVDPAGDVVHTVKAAKEERLSRPARGVGFGLLRRQPGSELGDRPLPSIAFNYLGGRGGGAEPDGTTGSTALPFTTAPHQVHLPPTVTGRLTAMAPLMINATASTGPGGPELHADFSFVTGVLDEAAVADLARRWSAELADLVAAVERRAPGLSPSDVPGAGLTQTDLDRLAADFGEAQIWPVTPLQEGLYFQAELAGDAAVDVYVTQATLGLGGDTDAARLRSAADRLLGHHRSLRSGFVRADGGSLVAVVPESVSVPWREVDLTAAADPAAAVTDLARAERLAPFDLSAPPLLRLVLARHRDGAALIVTNHHILFDGWSGPLVLADLLALYATGEPYTAGGADFGDYVRRIAGTDHAEALAAWRAVLAPLDEPTLVAPAAEATAAAMPRDLRVTLTSAAASGLERITKELGVTTATAVQFAWAVLLSRLTGSRVVSFGETVSGRPADLAGISSAVGLFINTLPVVVDVDPDATAAQILGGLQADKVSVLDHQHVGLPELIALTGRPTLFDTLTVFESYPVDADSLADADTNAAVHSAGGLHVTSLEALDATHYPLNLATSPTPDGLSLTVKYLPDAFGDEQIRVFADALVCVLTAIGDDPHVLVGDLPLVPADRSGDLLPVSGGPGRDPVVLRDLFAAAAVRGAGRTAVVAGDGDSAGYAELDAASDRLAAWLIARGVGPDVLVALALPRSVELLTAIWAVAKAGGAFLPVDPDYPADRIARMVTDSGVRHGLTVTSAATGLPTSGLDWTVLDEPGTAADISATAPVADLPVVHPDHLAYVIYTSGSTGRPKGVALTHRGLADFAAAESVGMRAGEGPVVLGFASPSFDAAILELLLATTGAGTLAYRPADALGGPELAQYISRRGITHVFLTPGVLGTLDPAALPDLAGLGSGGEAVPQTLIDAWAPITPITNMYGPSETTVAVTVSRPLHAGEPVRLGGPIPGTGLLVLDDRLHPVPVGVPGELYVTGAGLARGYLGRPGLAAQRFVADPHGAPGERMYRTGDVVRWQRDAAGDLVLDYRGRSDDQVKLRGLRIEPGEIESVLVQFPGVTSAVVVGIGGAVASTLAGYVVAPAGLDVAELRTFAAGRLPSYMVPSSIAVLDRLPLTPVGKVDKRALPQPAAGTADHVAPQGETEIAVAGVFAEILEVEQVSVLDDFFALGGNSLSAMRLVARVGDIVGRDLTVRDLFEAPSVRALIAGAGAAQPGREPVTAVEPRPERIPLSFAQQRMWLVNQLDTTSPADNIPLALRLTGELDVDALHAALIEVIGRHEVLRTVYPAADGIPHQKILRPSVIGARLDWDEAESLTEIQDALDEGFDVTRALPLRVRILASDPDEHVLAMVFHHIAFDGESMAPFVGDLMTAYLAVTGRGEPLSGPLQVQFADYAIWQHRVLGDPAQPDSPVGRQLDYWRHQLAGLPDLVELPADRARPATATHRGAQVPFAVSAETVSGVDRLAAGTGATPFMVVHAALAALIARLSAHDDIAVGTPIAGRGQAELDPLIGMFVNTLILRTRVDGAMSFAELLAEARTADLDAYANADVPFENVVDAVGALTSPAFSPLSQVWLTFDQSSLPAPAAGDTLPTGNVAGLTVAPLDRAEVPAKVDLLVSIGQAADGSWAGRLIYATDLFDESTVAGFADQLTALLHQAVADPECAVGDVALPETALPAPAQTPAAVPAAGVRHARAVSASPAVLSSGPGADPELLSEIFGRAAAAWGPRQAVIDPDGSGLTYAQLDADSNRLARWLIGRGVGPESLVALAIGRSAALLTAIWAVAKTGGGYVPIDPTYPADRVAAMVEDSGAVLGLTVGGSGELPQHGFDWVPVDSGDVTANLATLSDGPIDSAELAAPARIDNTAYLIYTSGSTGRPKGVSITHAGLANFAAEEVRRSGADQYARVLGFASPSFDASVLEYLLAAVSGGVLIYRSDDAVGGTPLQELMVRQAVTHTFLTPTVLATLDPAALPALRVVYVGGEAVPGALKDAWAPHRRIQNLYGPTEATIGVAIGEPMPVGERVRLGGPIAGVGFLILDDRLRPVPEGTLGELYLCGDALSRGYLGRAGLTAARFVANPYGIPGDRMYRTGDLVRRRTDDQGRPALDYTGRSDDQVKLRGLRIELGEIEAVLSEHPEVTAAVVVGVGGSVATALAGYVVCSSEVSADELRGFLGARLPRHMVPASFTILDAMPRTPVGKLDKAALPAPVLDHGDYVPPATPAEETTVRVFGEVLGVDEVSVTDSFFDLGGNSLSAMRAIGRIGETLDVDLHITDLFDEPTARGLAARIAGAAAALPPVVAVDPRPERIPLSFAQQRMWFINRLDPDAATYNIPALLRLTGAVDVEALRAAVADVTVRHEILRTRFPAVDGVPAQQIDVAESVRDRLDWRVVGSLNDLEAAAAAGFDVTRQWPLRVRLFAAAPDQHVLCVVVHHIAADGESMGPFLADLMAAYAARAAGRAPGFVPLPVQFADFAIWQHAVLGAPDDAGSVVGGQLGYWRDQLSGAPEVLALPTDRPRPAVASHRGAQHRFDLPAGLGERVVDESRRRGITPFIMVHAALAVLLSRLAATDDVCIATPIAGRGQRELDPLIGMFVGTLVLRTRIDQGRSFEAILDEVRGVDLAAFVHADVPFEAVVDAVDPVRSEAFSPLAQVVLAVDQGTVRDGDTDDSGGLTVEPVNDLDLPAQYDLHVNIATDGSPSWLLYATDLYDGPTVTRIAEWLVLLLEAVTSHPELPAGDVALLDADTRSAILSLSHGAPSGRSGEIIDAVDEQARRNPDAVAVRAGGLAYTYREVIGRADALAARLDDLAVGVDDVVVLVLDRSVEWIVGLIAVWKLGAAYAPVDPGFPLGRIGALIGDAGARALVAQPEWIAGHSGAVELGEVAVVPVDDASAAAPRPPIALPEGAGDRLAYVITTSGSTGRPKPTLVPMAGVANTWAWYRDELGLQPEDGVLVASSPTFDLTQKNVWAALAAGATVHLADAVFDPQQILRMSTAHPMTVMNLAPSAFEALAAADHAGVLTGLRSLFLGGEPVKRTAVEPLLAAGVRVFNSYGPTEASDVVSAHELSRGEAGPVPIGTPIPGLRLYVLDARLSLAPPGVTGELYVGGVAVGRGYGAMPGRSAERFLPDPFGRVGSRMYRTGDLARWNAHGELEYLGRTDGQIKLRGLRIELGEIEAALAVAPGVDRVAAAVVRSGRTEHLVAYLSPATVDVDAVTAAAKALLPGYMVPSTWVALDELALNAAGKIDRRALPTPDFAAAPEDFAAPRGEREERIADAIAEVLGVGRVSATASFFDLGGNSLAAVQVIARIEAVAGEAPPLTAFFTDATVRGLARASRTDAPAMQVLVPLRRSGSRAPLFCIHPAGGLAWSFGALASSLPDRPVYGLQDPAVVLGERPCTTVEEYADRYIDEIRAVAPAGPYNLLGWSLGGAIAFEIARRLQEQGSEVSFLGLMDTVVGPAFTDLRSAASRGDGPDTVVDEFLGGLIGQAATPGTDPRPRDGARNDTARNDTARNDMDWTNTARTNTDWEERAVEKAVALGLGTEQQARAVLASFEVADAALSAYRPGVVDGVLHYFTATADKPVPESMARSWRPHVRSEIVGVDVNTTHLSMGRPDALAVVGRHIESALLGAETAHRAHDEPAPGNAGPTRDDSQENR